MLNSIQYLLQLNHTPGPFPISNGINLLGKSVKMDRRSPNRHLIVGGDHVFHALATGRCCERFRDLFKRMPGADYAFKIYF